MTPTSSVRLLRSAAPPPSRRRELPRGVELVLPSGPFPPPVKPAMVRIRVTSGRDRQWLGARAASGEPAAAWIPVRSRQGRSRLGSPPLGPAGPFPEREQGEGLSVV